MYDLNLNDGIIDTINDDYQGLEKKNLLTRVGTKMAISEIQVVISIYLSLEYEINSRERSQDTYANISHLHCSNNQRQSLRGYQILSSCNHTIEIKYLLLGPDPR